MIAKSMCHLRGSIFWTLDKIRGNLVRSAYNDIRMIDELDSGDEYIRIYQNKRLDELLEHAIHTTLFYSKFNTNRLFDFPVVDKNIIRDNQESFVSSKYKYNDLFKMSTSGSTGTPFVCYQDLAKKKRVNAEIIYYSEKAGYSVGSNLVFFRVVTKRSRKSKFQQWIQNEYLIDINRLDDMKIASILARISDISKNNAMILAYPSTYDAFSNYISRKGFVFPANSNITGIVSSGSMLFDNTRNSMKEAFRCKVLSRYSNQENGIIGQDDDNNNVFILNESNYVVEILDFEKDEEVSEGVVGRIAVTDLYNFAMPMIRYDTGDIGSITRVSQKEKSKKAITNFGGRRIDVIFDSVGNRLSPESITNIFWEFPEIKQYQIIQQNKNTYVVKINVEKEFEKLDDMKLMINNQLGDKANITVEQVGEIPVLASGKRKYVVNEIKELN